MANKLFPESWAHTPACEYCDSVRDGTHDTPKPLDEGYPLVTSKFLRNGKVHVEEAYYISKEDFDAINARSKVEPWDVLMSMIGTIGELAIVREEPEYAIKNIALFKCGNPLKAEWLYYVLSSPQGRALLKSAERGTTQKFISLQQLRLMKIPVPPPSTMAAITEILSTIDAKIEHNNELIKMLEEQAQLVYDYWFMQFDFPDENEKPYRSSGGKMVWNDKLKREIPEGWKIAGIDRFLTLTRGVSYKPTDASDIPTPMHTCILRANNIDFGTIRWDGLVYVKTERVNQKTQRLKENDIVIVMSSGSKEHVGKTATAWGDLDCSYGAFCAKITPHEQCTSYVRTSLRSSTFRAFLKKQLLATNINNISLSVLANYIVPEPTYNVLERFQQITGEIYTRCNTLHAEIYELTKQRDFLLPLLMSGQVKVAE